MKGKSNPFPLLGSAILALAANSVCAATWTGTTNASWATGTNWTGTAPDNVTPQAAVFDSTSTANLTQTLDGSYTVTGITLTSPTAALVVNAGAGTNTLTLGSGGIDLSAATQNLTLNVNTTVDATQSWNIAPGRTLLRSGGTTTFGTGTITTLSGAGIVTFGGTNHILTGAGDLVIDGASLYNDFQAGGSSAGRAGATTLNSGLIRISTSISLFGTGSINLNGGAIGSFSTTGRVIGSNNVNIGGNIQIGSNSGPLSTGFIRFDGATDLGGATREINVIATGLNTNFGSGAIFTGPISNGGITKTGSGIITVNNNSTTFTGATTVNAGSLAISQSALQNSGSVTLANTGVQLFLGQNGAGTHTLNNLNGVAGTSIRTDFSLSGTNANRSLTVNQTVDGEFAGNFVQGGSRAFEIVKAGPATLTLSGAGGHTLGTTISAGTLKIGGAGLLGAASYAGTITNEATLHFDSTAAQTLTGTLTGNGTLLKSNSGSLTLSGTATAFTGGTTVGGGILNVNTAIGGNLFTNGGRLLLNSSIGGNVTATSTGTIGGTGGSIGSLDMSGTSTLLLEGGATTTGLSFNEVTFADTVYLEFGSSPVNATVYDVVTYGAGGLTGFASLSPLARGTLTDDTVNSKITFTAGAPGTRTWNTGDGVWDRFGTLTNWLEGDQVYYQGDDVIFDDILSDTVITLDGLLAPFSVTVENTANSYTFTGTGGLSGNGFFDKFGAGTLVIANANANFTGPTLIVDGLFRIIDGGSWGTGSIENNATLEVNQTNDLTLSAAISGTGTLVKNNTGTLRLTGANSHSQTTLNGGILQAGATNAFGSGTLTINGGIISSDSGTTRTLSNGLALNANASFGDGTNGGQLVFEGPVDLQGGVRTITSVLGNQGVRFNGVVSDGGLTIAGTGRVTLANDTNTFTGATTISEGILASSTSALATSSSLTIADGAQLALGSNGTTLINNLNGTTGSLIVSNFNISTDGARTLEVNQTVDGEFGGSNTQGANRVISLIKSGSAILSLTGPSTYTGTTTVGAGTLRLGGAGTLGNGTYAGAITNDATLHFDSTATQTLSGLISGTGTLLKSNTGTLILTNNNDGNTGSITVNAGTLQVGNNTTAGFIGNSVTVTNNAALVWYRSNDTNVENDIAGTGTLTKLGGAILSLNGDSTYTGATTVSSGTLRVNGSLGNTAVTVENGATLAVNGNIGGSVTIEAGATHALAVADTPANQVTRLIGGSLDLSAIGDILALDAASTPAAGTYILATATGGITGSPETINQTGVSGGFTIVGNNLVLTVGGNDYDDWAGPSGFNLTQAATGDDDGDGLTNFEEYAFGLDPTNPASVSPITAPDKTAGTFTYTRRKPSLTGLTYTYHSSTTLTGIWPAFTPPSADVSSNGDPVETITVTIPAILLDEPALFLRVEATQP